MPESASHKLVFGLTLEVYDAGCWKQMFAIPRPIFTFNEAFNLGLDCFLFPDSF